MKGTIAMEFDGSRTKISIKADNVGTADKCVVVDNLLNALAADKFERLLILATVTQMIYEKEDKDESRRIRN